jgi:hypothetical protein
MHGKRPDGQVQSPVLHSPSQQVSPSWQQYAALPSPHRGPDGQQAAAAATEKERPRQHPPKHLPSQHWPAQHSWLPTQQKPPQQVPSLPMQVKPSGRGWQNPSWQVWQVGGCRRCPRSWRGRAGSCRSRTARTPGSRRPCATRPPRRTGRPGNSACPAGTARSGRSTRCTACTVRTGVPRRGRRSRRRRRRSYRSGCRRDAACIGRGGRPDRGAPPPPAAKMPAARVPARPLIRPRREDAAATERAHRSNFGPSMSVTPDDDLRLPTLRSGKDQPRWPGTGDCVQSDG